MKGDSWSFEAKYMVVVMNSELQLKRNAELKDQRENPRSELVF